MRVHVQSGIIDIARGLPMHYPNLSRNARLLLLCPQVTLVAPRPCGMATA